MPSDINNSKWQAIQYISIMVFSLITLKLNLLNFGKTLFGSWLIIKSFWLFGAALDFGFSTALVKFVAEYKQHQEDKLRTLISSNFLIFVLLGFVIVSVGLLIGYTIYFTAGSPISEELFGSLFFVFVLLGFSFFLQYVSLFFRAIFEGLNNFVLSSKIILLQSTSLVIFVCIVFITDSSILYLALSYTSSWLITVLAFLILFTKKYPHYRISFTLFDKTQVKKVFNFSIAVQFISGIQAGIDPAIKYIIGRFHSEALVSIYEIGRLFAKASSGLFFAIFKILLPKTSVLNSKTEFAHFIEKTGITITRIGVTYSAIIYGLFLLPIALFIDYWYGYPEAILFFIVLALPESLNNVGYTIYMFLLGIGKVIYIAFTQVFNITLIAGLLTLGFSYYDSWLGLFGFYCAIALITIANVLYARHLAGFSLSYFILKSKVYKILLLQLFLFISFYLIYCNIYPYTYVLLVQFLLSGIIYYEDFIFLRQLFLSKYLHK